MTKKVIQKKILVKLYEKKYFLMLFFTALYGPLSPQGGQI